MSPILAALAADPAPLTRQVTVAGVPFTVRALVADDRAALAAFLTGLSDTSRRYWHGDADPVSEAAGWIDAIGRYDKLRLVAERTDRPGHLTAVVDLSFAPPPEAEPARYAAYGCPFDPIRTVRFGPCVADRWHGSGLAAALLPPTWNAVRLLGRDRVVLLGGVHADNHRARRFYRRCGFTEAGTFRTDAGSIVDMVLDLGLPGGPVLPDAEHRAPTTSVVDTDRMTTADRQRRLTALYAAFNRRDVTTVLAALTPDVHWPNGWEGGTVTGHEEVAAYWRRQWAQLDPSVEPTAFAVEPDGRIAVTVHQVVRDQQGDVLADHTVTHLYRFAGDLVAAMEVRD